MHVSRTRDKKAILKIVNHYKVRKWCVDDLSPDNYTPIMHDSFIYLVDDDKTGVIVVEPMNGICCKVHIATRPEMWGKAVEFVMSAKAWLFKNTHYLKVVALVPKYNRLAVRVCRKTGFAQEGVITKAFMRNWDLHDWIVFGLNKVAEG
jgi:RimJ/RimL family protein N-acetyltransferase